MISAVPSATRLTPVLLSSTQRKLSVLYTHGPTKSAEHREDRLRYAEETAARADGESIAYTYAAQSLEIEGDYVNYHGNETRIAHGLVRQ